MMIRYPRRSADCDGICLHNNPSRGCVQPPPVPGQCSFPFSNATILCDMWEDCRALNCNVLREDCQARDTNYKLTLSFGDADAYVKSSRNVRNLHENAMSYRKRFKSDYFVHDALYVYRTFFRDKWNGFFIESGALDGSVHGSNSYYFERYMGWRGLLVEASLSNCNRLEKRRNESPRVTTICTALCSFDGKIKFSSTGGCCGTVGHGDSYVNCTKTQHVLDSYKVKTIDFWSLDVEGGEMDVLQGLTWSVPIGVMLIESVTPAIRKLLKSRGFKNHPFHSPSKLNEIWFNRSYFVE